MKKSMLLLLGMLVIASIPVMAQDDYPKVEVFGGFSLLNFNPQEMFDERQNAYGFQANVAGNLHENFGIEADFGGQYKKIEGYTLSTYEFLFGPRFTFRAEKASFFAHALIGGAHVGIEEYTDNGLAMGFGGGVDVNVNDRFAVRVVQFDWIPSKFEGEWSNDTVRFGFGVVIK
jgi:hypothetical protein